jgi:hypothetical protein
LIAALPLLPRRAWQRERTDAMMASYRDSDLLPAMDEGNLIA